jgi:hypothetical protein
MGVTPARSRVRTARLLLQGLSLVWTIAFASLAVQVEGLYGSRGVLPVADHLAWLSSRFGDAAWREVPTVLWFSSGDAALVSACWAGAAAALVLMAGALPTLAAAACWVLYFSLFQVGRVFLGFQWDTLLLEAGFLAIFLAPPVLRLREGYDPEPSPVVLWLLRWLLFRLMFASGLVKLLSGDATWWDLTALEYHYWTQPLPTWTAWIAHQLPSLVHRACVAGMFAIELVVPWFVFGPRRLRLAAFFALLLLQAAIAATGNYGFFNLLTAVLCLSLVDDDFLDAAGDALRTRRRAAGRLVLGRWPAEPRTWTPRAVATRAFAVCLALPLAVAGGAAMADRAGAGHWVPAPVSAMTGALESWRVVSSYGLFAAMTKHRPEVVLEGTEDGVTWVPYRMRWKPGPVERRPRFVAPYQPRLDWQMWFAALGDHRRSPWLVAVERRLLEGSPAVLGLFADDPFDGRRPRAVRAMLYEYEFTDRATWGETGAWWKRRLVGPFSPPLSH